MGSWHAPLSVSDSVRSAHRGAALRRAASARAHGGADIRRAEAKASAAALFGQHLGAEPPDELG